MTDREPKDRRARRTAARLVGEFVMLVVGVLVALSADSWWANRQDRAEIDALLENVASELRENETELTETLTFTETMLDHNRDLLRVIEGYRPRPAEDSLMFKVFSTMTYRTPTLSFGTYDILLSRGSTEFVDPDLLTDLASLVVTARRGRGTAEAMEERTAEVLTDLIGGYGGLLSFTPEDFRDLRKMPTPTTEPDFDGMLADPAFRNYAALAYTLGDNRRMWLEARLEEVEALLAELQER